MDKEKEPDSKANEKWPDALVSKGRNTEERHCPLEWGNNQ